MVARGGLDVEMGYEKVPMAERLLINKARAAGKPVITATQMLESMTNNPRPTRAEANDAATAVLLGTDALMLSAETTTGRYPVESVRTLTRIADEMCQHIEPREVDALFNNQNITINSLTRSAASLCIKLEHEIKKVVIISKSGFSARQFLRHIIKQPVFVYTSEEEYRRQVLLSSNVQNAFILDVCMQSRDCSIDSLKELVVKNGVAVQGEKVLFLAQSQRDGSDYFPNIFEIVEI
jgi:pyruvate kinase